MIGRTEMADTLMADQQQSTPPVFEYRQPPPTKRRKFMRKRTTTSDDEADSLSKSDSKDGTNPTPHTKKNSDDASQSTNEEDGGLGTNASSLAELARLRKKAARSRQGLQLAVPTVKPTEEKKGKDSGEGEEMSEEKKEEERIKEEELARITGRFTQQTGQILDVDKHMMEYIEKKMSIKNATTTTSTYANSSSSLLSTSHSQTTTRVPPRPTSDTTSQPATPEPTSAPTTNTSKPPGPDSRFGSDVQMRGVTLGKLHEVDLGEEAKMRNIARTQAATRRLEGKEPIQEEEEPKSGKKKGRWKRKRRNSQDLQRDKLVEEVLKETRLEIYDEPEKEEEQVDDEGATDDRIVEKFRKEFLDAMSLKRGRRRPAATAKKDDKTKPRGPKLGGSRMARAAMREAQVGAAGKK